MAFTYGGTFSTVENAIFYQLRCVGFATLLLSMVPITQICGLSMIFYSAQVYGSEFKEFIKINKLTDRE